ncbi:hypothetical protein TanjilG_08605 [Lupinus angustifolius]|uniref:Uncharacterized protein n=1 Tax=Lupinus angustifolius TaxID=3871 RepID=A0A4P1RP51_LUPAN|nr:hypothetical protein TanjilG_08605 [Lupinus angustifolius]
MFTQDNLGREKIEIPNPQLHFFSSSISGGGDGGSGIPIHGGSKHWGRLAVVRGGGETVMACYSGCDGSWMRGLFVVN